MSDDDTIPLFMSANCETCSALCRRFPAGQKIAKFLRSRLTGRNVTEKVESLDPLPGRVELSGSGATEQSDHF